MIRANRAGGSSDARLVAAVALGSALLILGGCSSDEVMPVPTPTATTPTPTPTPTPDPEFIVGGTAGQNRPYFEFVVDGLLATTPEPSSLAIVDALTAAGFDRAAMEVTEDTTRIGVDADSILFSVIIDGQCLLGQVADGSLTTALDDVLGSGRCLVGRTLSLD